MRRWQWLKGVAVGLSALGIMLPPSAQAAGPRKAAASRPATAPVYVDVALKSGGVFSGVLVDPQGKPVEGAEVAIRQGQAVVARAVTNDQGVFEVKGLRGGSYHVAAGQSEGLFRVWAEQTAPPNASAGALIVTGGPTVRGQYGGIDAITLITLGAAITGVTLAAINLNKLNKLENQHPASP